ncbi:hypothetical protein O6H91_10G013500 [Diphasiastrum complanatum]|uniref:Uncharacterized protein n=1 Tax=Diphasiastrum complanatum TaxID=34168 RepID=A0ACC2CEH5_DIPCM|nr:hypothetical protein O6H91_10G013500 [Diphasiastrum complanatum]
MFFISDFVSQHLFLLYLRFSLEVKDLVHWKRNIMQILQQSLSSLVRSQPLAVDRSVSCPVVKRVTVSALVSKPSTYHGVSASTFRHHALVSRIPHGVWKKNRGTPVVATATDVAANYASALADFANSKKVLEAVSKDIETLSAFMQKKELYDFLANPVIVDDKKKSILKALADDARFQECTLNFLYLLVDTKRVDLIHEILKEFVKAYNNLTDTQVAIVTSAIAINSSQLSLIAKKIQSMSKAKNVRLKNVIDPTLIAGFMIKFGNDGSRLIDLSVKGQLERIAAQLESTEKVKTY